MSKLIFLFAYKCVGYLLVALSMLVTNASAETITVPFGWATGQVRNYQLSFHSERLGDFQGGNCTVNGQLRVEVLKRDGKSANLRFQLSALNVDNDCKTPALTQALWLRLSKTPLDATLEPETGKVFMPGLASVREKVFASLDESPTLFGKSVGSDIRLEISRNFRQLLFADATIVAQVTGFIDVLTGVIGEVYETDTTSSFSTSLPSPFGGAPLPATVSVEAKSGVKGSGEFSIKQNSQFDPGEFRAALLKMIGQSGGAKVFRRDLEALEKGSGMAGALLMQRIEQRTGWIIESESITTAYVGKDKTVLTVKMLYRPAGK